VPKTGLIFYCDDHGWPPLVEWLTDLRRRNKKAYAKCAARIQVPGQLGHELRPRWPIIFETVFTNCESATGA